MATVEYDLDTSGGLMEQIQKLVAPPVSDEVLRRQRRREREYRRAGRTVNHDCCDSCQEGGDLLCCDWCPAAFHLQCHDPPLEEDDVPPGEWKCHRCKVSPPKPEKDDDASSTKSGSSTGTTLPRGTKSRPVKPPTPPLAESEEAVGMEDPLAEDLSPLEKLAKAAKLMNPQQFELPRDIACTIPLPGSSKRKWWGRDRNPNKKLAHEMDNAMVPLPAKLCFTCNKSCRVGPLIQCDYCPLLFHMDCLNPPLASLPTNRWMCPNHPEHAVDQLLLKSLSLSERVKLWDKFHGHVNQHTVKVHFVNKVHRESPPFRIKRRHPKRKSIAVPEAIKLQYQYPPSMLPGIPRPVRLGDENRNTDSMEEATPEEQEEWLTAVVALQTNIAKHLAQKQIQKNSVEGDNSCRTDSLRPEKPTASVQPVVQGGDHSEHNSSPDKDSGQCDVDMLNGPLDISKGGAVSLLNPFTNSVSSPVNGDIGETSKSKSDTVVMRARRDSVEGTQSNIMRVNWTTEKSSSSVTSNKNFVISAISKVNNAVVTKVLGSTQGGKILTNNLAAKNSNSILSPRVASQSGIKVSAIQGKTTTTGAKPGSSPVGSNNHGTGSKSSNQGNSTNSSSSSSNAIVSLNNSLQQCLDGSGDKELSKLDDKLIQILAWQRLQQLLPSKSAPPSTPVSKGNDDSLPNQGAADIKARAVLCPLTTKGQPIPMPYRTLNIGTGADMDMCLLHYGHCNFISPKHAFIFYDETTKHYELLNYSEHGTTVDNVLYSCDFSDKPATTPQPTPVVAAVRSIIKTKQEKLQEEREQRVTMSAKASTMKKPCNCKSSSSNLIGGSGAGWEGTALLHHGSYIKVGCLQFVFSIVDQATDILSHERKKEPMSLLKSTLRGTDLELLK